MVTRIKNFGEIMKTVHFILLGLICFGLAANGIRDCGCKRCYPGIG